MGHLPLDQVAQSPVQTGLEHCQGGGIHSLAGQPVPVPHHPHSEEFLPFIYSKATIFQSKAITPCPIIFILHRTEYFSWKGHTTII